MNVNATAPRATGNESTPPPTPAKDAKSTFLSLLVTELKAQDPTSPMDPTQMVAQMLSMNQLDQLIQINQTLQASLPANSSSSQSGAH